MKNIQVIDSARNTAYDIYACTDDEFGMIFPETGQNIEFIEDLADRIREKLAKLLASIWKRPVKKQDVVGIHGTLFYELRELKKDVYPNKRESDLDGSGRPWIHG